MLGTALQENHLQFPETKAPYRSIHYLTALGHRGHLPQRSNLLPCHQLTRADHEPFRLPTSANAVLRLQ